MVVDKDMSQNKFVKCLCRYFFEIYLKLHGQYRMVRLDRKTRKPVKINPSATTDRDGQNPGPDNTDSSILGKEPAG